METPIIIVVLAIVILIIFAISVMFITNLGKSGEDTLSFFYKWLSGSVRF